MSYDSLQVWMRGFTPILDNLLPVENLDFGRSMAITPNSVLSFEMRMGKQMFEREGLFNGEGRLEEAIRKLKLDDNIDDHQVMTALADFERVFPDDDGVLSKINDVFSEEVRTVYTRSGKIDSYIDALRRKVALSTILPFDELPYEDSFSANWMSRNPRLNTLEPHRPVYMTHSMHHELLFKNLDPVEVNVDIDIDSIQETLLTFDSCQITILKLSKSRSFSLSIMDVINSQEFELEDSPGTRSLITMFITMSGDEDLYRCGVLSNIAETNSRMFYIGHMMTFEEMINYSRKHEYPFRLVQCQKSQFNYICSNDNYFDRMMEKIILEM